MPMAIMFWVLMTIWLVLGLVTNWPGGSPTSWPYGGVVSSLLLFILFVLLGWHAFGAPLR